MASVKRILLPIIFSLLFVSCGYVKPGLLVFWGNYNMDQGNFQRANIAYLNALEESLDESIVHYNLGNAYYSLGESESAMIRWNKSEGEEGDFQFRLVFNRGVYYYERGLYSDAALAFKEAVLIDASSLEAKINLELSLNRVNTGMERSLDDGDARDDTLYDDTERLLKYLRRQETFTWESGDNEYKSGRNDW